MKKLTCLVLGGHGFIGRHIVKHLQKQGAEVIIGTRAIGRPLRPGERFIAFHGLHPSDWGAVIQGCDVVINAVGILRQRCGESYERVHHHAVAQLAQACKNAGTKLIHVSALGLYAPVTSRFLTSKRNGEQALMNSDANWFLVRPSLLDGRGGFGARWFRKVARWPIHLTPANALGKIAPLHVEDLGRAIANLALCVPAPTNHYLRIYELGGNHRVTIREYLKLLKGTKPLMHIALPGVLVRLVSHILDVLHLTPLSFGHYQLLQRDNTPTVNRLNELLEAVSLSDSQDHIDKRNTESDQHGKVRQENKFEAQLF